jgi:uncharacterized membrane protein
VFRFIRATLAGGLLFLVPIVVLAVIIEKALAVAHKIVAPLAAELPPAFGFGFGTPRVLAVSLILLSCFLAGVFARTSLARRMVAGLESKVLLNLPGYEFFKSIGESVLGVDDGQEHDVVIARFDDYWQLGFLVDRLDNGLVTVFIPDAPNPHSGTVVLLTADRVTAANIPMQAALKSLKRLGAGSKALLRGVPLKT